MKFYTAWDMQYWMKSNGFFVGLNTPPALVSKKEGDSEYQHGLPPYAKRQFFLVDEFPACPKNWMRSEGKMTSYFVPVEEDKGMWLDFNRNWDNKYHVAMVISVQGINPITGLPCNDAHLEQYVESCPKCKEKFGPERLCKKCGYKWPKQNYISTTATPSGQLWLDGFRSAEGIVRQYILTQEKIRGVATNVIGKDRVYAVGVSFFLSKLPKPADQQPKSLRDRTSQYNGGAVFGSSVYHVCCAPTPLKGHSLCSESSYGDVMDSTLDLELSERNLNRSRGGGMSCSSVPAAGAASDKSDETAIYGDVKGTYADNKLISPEPTFFSPTCTPINWNIPKEVKTRQLEVGAGANISQITYDDPEPLDFWRTDPESIICINYCAEIDTESIIKAGRVKLDGHPEGFLNNIPVGNLVAAK